jgi:hypothetical protein
LGEDPSARDSAPAVLATPQSTTIANKRLAINLGTFSSSSRFSIVVTIPKVGYAKQPPYEGGKALNCLEYWMFVGGNHAGTADTGGQCPVRC